MDIKDIEKLAALARISLQENEKKSLLHEMDSILEYVGQIKEAAHIKLKEDKSPIKPPNFNSFREDGEPHPGGAFTEKLLNSAPNRHNGYLKVKKIL